GNAHYHNRDKLLNKDENYILVAPHRTWWETVSTACYDRRKAFNFMAKKELYRSCIFGRWMLMCGEFPSDGEDPGHRSIKYHVNMLQKGNRRISMCPSVSRHPSDAKGDVAVIAQMAKLK
ncbi:1-acyl-sn-glycerol-3-phosphate acyltransferase, partial [Klebsiella pneumoniae]|nr:1-acyl-sn-glycerol-3-phosphate acyltransferase [Klebsiella pneumoniae]